MPTEYTHLYLVISSFRQQFSGQYAEYQKRSQLTPATLICHVSFEYLQKKWAWEGTGQGYTKEVGMGRHWAGIHKFYKNLGANSKFQGPEE